MVIAITILSTVVAIMMLFLIAAILHITKIQKELKALADVNAQQDKMLDNAAHYLRDLALAIKDIQDYLLKQQGVETSTKVYKNPFGGPMGEA